MKQLFYQIIYHPGINKMLRNLNKWLAPVLPAKLRIPPSGTITIRNSKGQPLHLKTNQTNYVTYLLFWNNDTHFEYSAIFTKLIQKVKVFYDIGANIGYYSLLAESENPNVNVVAFEPASGPLYYLNENVVLNGFKNIRVESLALSDSNGEITFYEIKNKKYSYLQHNLAGESNAGSNTINRNFVPVQVKTTTLNNYVTNKGEKQIDLIKMDTEGTEHFILKEAGSVLEHMKPIVICETLFNTIEKDLQEIFTKYGYSFYNHTPDGLKKVNTIMREKDDGVRNCFFVHPSKLDLIAEFVI